MTEASNCAQRTIESNLYAREVRFGVVMYGGVSLAIYINGVTNELYEMACATPKVGGNDVTGRTRDVYLKASWLLRDKGLRDRYLAHLRDRRAEDPFRNLAAINSVERTRFVVDTIAGTSAGGINGLFLAKALANGQEFAPLKKLWVEEGDIGSLLNDSESYEGLAYARSRGAPQSLLNGDRMYVKLSDAFRGMAPVIPPRGKSESALADEIDLFITTTDIRGAVVPLRLFDKVVYERRYKQVYHFRYEAANGKSLQNDLRDENTPFLAFAARCTSSFPFAFEPMTVVDAERLWNARPTAMPVDFDQWKSFFTGLSRTDIAKGSWRTRAFGDGGYLDNKPFSFVVNALSLRLGGLPIERKLIYVEPSPDHPETERVDGKPDAVENAFGALFSIPQDETIREDLEAVLARNRRIERVERIVRQVETEIEKRSDDPFARIVPEGGKVPPWRSRDMRDMVDYYGAAFLPYRQLRVMTATDNIADRLAVWWDIDDQSDRLYALRAMARVWRDARYYENKKRKDADQDQDSCQDQDQAQADSRAESVNAFLEDYDVKYYLRRAGFILRKTHQLLALVMKLRLPEDQQALSDIEKHLCLRWKRGRPSLKSMHSERLADALTFLAGGLGKAIGEIRKVTSLQAPAKSADKRKEHHDDLDRVLHLLLGVEASSWPAELPAVGGETVSVSTDLPLPSPLRTLQENVYDRAKKLYEYAQGAANLTGLQKALEDDIGAMKDAYAAAVHGTFGPADVPTVFALLGGPTLVVKDDASGHKVDIDVGDVTVPCYAARLNTPEARSLREFLSEYYMRFDEYDQVSFPLYYDTGTGEPSTVEVVRISPEDACSLVDETRDRDDKGQLRRKLAGTELFHFGAFLDAKWRHNDIMWGRLDGCERLFDILFPAPDDKDIKQSLLAEAQRTIVREEMQPEGYGKLLDSFAQALRARPDATLGAMFDELWARLPLAATGQRRVQTAQLLKAVLGDASMLEYVRRYYAVDRQLDTKSTLNTGARALTITGRVLEDIEKNHQTQWTRMVWLTRSGRAFQVLLTISTPGGLEQAVFRHWLGLLYVFELVIIGGAILFSSTAARNFGLAALGVTAVAHLASLITGDLLGRRFRWLKGIGLLLGFAVIVLALLGMMAMVNGGGQGIYCPAGQNVFGWVFNILCR